MTSIALTADGELVSMPNISEGGRPVFRKECPSELEKAIAGIFLAYPHPNVVNIYRISNDYIDMELLSNDVESVHPLDKHRAHEYFKQHGIVLIDWDLSVWGSDIYGIPKIQDFELAGLMSLTLGCWLIAPKNSASYQEALRNGAINPLDVDNFTAQ